MKNVFKVIGIIGGSLYFINFCVTIPKAVRKAKSECEMFKDKLGLNENRNEKIVKFTKAKYIGFISDR